MIHSFSFKNFCSFDNTATISFSDASKSAATENNMFARTSTGEHISKVMMVIGPNASGKTSALKALAFLQWFVRYSFVSTRGEGDKIPLDGFAFTDAKNLPSDFELIFEYNNIIYKYYLQLCETHVICEELYRKEETNHFNYIFKRHWNAEKGQSDLTQRIDLQVDILKNILRKNVSLFSVGVAVKNMFLTDLMGFWDKIISNVNRVGKMWETSSLGEQGIYEAAKLYKKDIDLFGKVTKFLKDIDLGLDDVRIQETEEKNQFKERSKYYIPYGIHQINNKQYELPFAFESSGTKNMFVLLGFLFPAIANGGVAVIDELELDLHPHALPRIVGLFADPSTNPKNSQLIFTSHSLEVLNYLEKEQVILVEKGNNCRSELYRLDELKGVRRDDNIYAKYMAGAYGAVPNL